MKIGVTVWNNRIAPVWDCAGTLLLQDTETQGETILSLQDLDIVARLALLRASGVETLICGAISRQALVAIKSSGIRVFPFISGGYREVIEGWWQHRLGEPEFAMPGCCRRGQRCGRTDNHHEHCHGGNHAKRRQNRA